MLQVKHTHLKNPTGLVPSMLSDIEIWAFNERLMSFCVNFVGGMLENNKTFAHFTDSTQDSSLSWDKKAMTTTLKNEGVIVQIKQASP